MSLLVDRHQGEDLVVRGRDTVLRLSLVQDGAAVVPSAASCQLLTPAGAVVAEPVVTRGSTSTATVAAADTEGQVLGDGWAVLWTVTADGVELQFQHAAALVLRGLAPVITEADLYARNPALDPAADRPLTEVASLRRAVEQSWLEIQDQLRALGRRPWLILEPSALRSVHLHLALALLFEELATTNVDAYGASAQHHRRNFDGAWRRLDFQYDSGEGRPSLGADGNARRRRARPVTFLCAASDRY